jgi:hypothetical protein
MAADDLVGGGADRDRLHLRVERVIDRVVARGRIVGVVEEPLQPVVGFGDEAVEAGGDEVLGASHR